MKIEEILRLKGHDVATVTASHTVLEAIRILVDRNIGSLVVVDGERTIGIFTERDILRLAARSPGKLDATKVGDVMTRDPVTAALGDQFDDVMQLMTRNRIRHLPVMDAGGLAGIISIGDLVKACLDMTEQENIQLRDYIGGAG